LKLWLVVAGAVGFAGVAAGAFGAHALQAALDAERLALWETAARYQMFHVAPLLAVSWLSSRTDATPAVLVAGWSFTLGILLFRTVYAVALGGPSWLGAITPVGGVLLLAGWLALARQGLVLARRSPGE
jgi:uncharacterized membrane protein YgdD (TMEM256/DUF423 family)